MIDTKDAELIPELDRSGLRKFGITIGSVFAVLFGVILPITLSLRFPVWPWILALVLIVWGLVAPSGLRIVYRGWMRIGLLLNRIVSPIVLGLIFFLIVTPFGLIMRLFGQNPMDKKRDSENSSRIQSAVRDPKHVERPY